MNMNESGVLFIGHVNERIRASRFVLPGNERLACFAYEFDRLLESYSPVLYNHLVKQGIKSSMYASQWFLTFFAYKFPLDIVLRIYDIIVTQGWSPY